MIRIAAIVALALALSGYDPITYPERSVGHNHHQKDTSKADITSLGFPRIGGTYAPQINTDPVWSDNDWRFARMVADSCDMWEFQGGRIFTPEGDEFADSLTAWGSDLLISSYTRVDHAPQVDPTTTLTAIDSGAGFWFYRVETVGQNHVAYNAAGDTAFVWVTGTGTDAALWNHIRGKEAWYDWNRQGIFDYTDSLSRGIGRFPDVPIDQFRIDHVPMAQNVWNSGTSTRVDPSYTGGGIDYDDDGTNDYVSYSWQAGTEDIQAAYYGWIYDKLKVMQNALPWVRFTLNGNMLGDWEHFDEPLAIEALQFVDGANFEQNGVGAGTSGPFKSFCRTTAYDSIRMASFMRDTYGKEWCQLAPGTSTNDANTEAALAYSLLAGAWVNLVGGPYDTEAEMRNALEILTAYKGIGIPNSPLFVTDNGDGTTTLLREYTNGRAWGVFDTDGDCYTANAGYPTSSDPDLAGVDLYVTIYNPNTPIPEAPPSGPTPNTAPQASFTVSTTDSLGFDYTSTATDIDGTVDTYVWEFGDGQGSLLQNPSHTFEYWGGNRYTRHRVVDNDGAISAYDTTIVYVRPGWVVGDLEIITSDSLSYTFLGSAFVPSGWNTKVDQYISVRPGTNYEDDIFSTQHEVTLPAGLDSVVVRHVASINYGGQGGEVSDLTDYWIPVADPPSEGPENVAPVASFTVDETNTPVIDFTDTSTDSDGTIVSWLWDFGDGSDDNTQNPTKTYGLCDCTRTVILTVTDDDGDSDSDTTTVDIAAPPAGTPTIATATPTSAFETDDVVTIAGSSFGANGPLVEFFETFENGSNGATFDQPDASHVGSWDRTSDPAKTTYSTTAASGNLALETDNTGESSQHYIGAPFVNGTQVADGDEIFVVWWHYIDNGYAIGGVRANWKPVWLAKKPPGGGYLIEATDNASDMVLWSYASTWRLVGNSSPFIEYIPSSFTQGRWHRWSAWFRASTDSDGAWELSEVNSGNAWNVVETDLTANFGGQDFQTTHDSDDYWSGFLMNGTGYGPAIYRIDDVYFATGPGARARVELGNNASYTSCTDLHIQYPTAWATDEITVQFNPGSFSAEDQAWLFVVDSNGTPSTGYEITVGGSGAPTAPTISDFEADDLEPTTTQSVDFTATLGGGTPTSYTWRWGDGTSFGTTAAPSHTFSSAGTYDVTLVVSNSAGADSTTKNNYITSSVGNSPPSAAIAVTDSASVDAVVLDRSSSTDSDGTIDTTRWTPWSGSWTRVANQDTIVVDYTSQQSTGDVVVEPKVVVVDNDSAADSTTTFYTIPGTGGGGDPFSDDFEDGTFTPFTALSAVNADIDISAATDSFSSYAGTYHGRIDNVTTTFSRGFEFPVDLSGQSEVYLEFWVNVTSGNTDFNSSNHVALSDDSGSNFTSGYSHSARIEVHNQTPLTWTKYTYDLDAVATSMGLSLNANNVIRLSFRTVADAIVGIDNVTVGTGDPP